MLKILKVVFSSSFCAQLISVLTYVLITRTIEPSVYGEYIFYLSIASILTPLVIFRIDQSIFSRKMNEEAAADVIFAKKLITLFLIICFLILCTLFLLHGKILERGLSGALIVVLLIYALGTGVLNYNFIIFIGSMKNISLWPIFQNIIFLFTIVLLYKFNSYFVIFAIAFLLSRLIPSYFLSRKFLAMHCNAKKNSTDGPSLSDRLKLQRRPILIALCDQAIVTIPTITLYMMYPNFIVGIISLAVSLLQSPTTLIATSFSTTILVELSKSSNRMKISNELLRRFLLIHILLIVLGTIIGVITGFMLASINLGSWNGISYVLIIQSLPFMLMTMWIPLSSILQSLGHWKMRLNIGYLQLITIIISMLLAKFLDLEWKSFVIIYACAIFIANIIGITKSINLIKNLVLTEET